ncbi:putative RNA-directed DNA polymerase from transposon BS [Trichonephila clavipes]|nr:putative RNA-directed DNA polymerase from transposon BS [Trichonephila clavipes]
MSDIFEIQHDSHLLVYADDIFLYNSGTNWNKTIGEMQESLNKISVWCKKWKLSTSPEKSSLLNFSRKRSTIPPLLKICDKPIPEVKSLKILGIIFDPNTTWKNHINYLRQKGFKYLNAIKALSSPKIGTRSDHLLNIINATIRSIFDYGSQLFSFSSNSNRQKLEPIYNAALRLALGLPRNTPLDLLRAESMNGNINSRHNFLCQKFITKQIALKDWSPNARLFWNIDSNFYKYREKEISIFQKTINLLQELCISKYHYLSGFDLQHVAESTGIGKGTTFVMARFKIPVAVFTHTLTTLTRPSLPGNTSRIRPIGQSRGLVLGDPLKELADSPSS